MRALVLALMTLALTANVAAADEGGSGMDVLPYDPGLPESPYDPGFPETPYDPSLPEAPYDPGLPDVPYDPGLPAISAVAISIHLLNT
jgi:hypothetical protein